MSEAPKFAIETNQEIKTTYSVCDADGNVRWTYDDWNEALQRVELENDRAIMEKVYASNLRLAAGPCNLVIRGDEKVVMTMVARTFSCWEEFAKLIRENPDDEFLLYDVKSVNETDPETKKKSVKLQIRFNSWNEAKTGVVSK